MDVKLVQALKGYGATKSVELTSDDSGGNALGQAARDFTQTLAKSEAVATQAMTGSADPHALVEALANTQLAVETAVTVRDRVVEAYQEILRMPV
ncbi:MAG: flagellar hook-basal body complex protein FliE [Silicimonas sp.]|nr:flagellar hook-basal body complex protein FliE [Silicimonas sp.]